MARQFKQLAYGRILLRQRQRIVAELRQRNSGRCGQRVLLLHQEQHRRRPGADNLHSLFSTQAELQRNIARALTQLLCHTLCVCHLYLKQRGRVVSAKRGDQRRQQAERQTISTGHADQRAPHRT